jgi:hypothetical protein
VTAGLSIDVILWSATVNFSLFNETLGCYSVPGSQQPGLTITESSTHLKPTSPGNTATFKAKCPGCQDLQWQIIGGIDGDSLSSSSRPRTVLTVADVAPRTLTVQATATTSSGQTLSDQVTVDVGDVCTLTPPADLTVDANELTWSAPSAGCSSQVSAYRVVESQYSQGQCQSNHLLVDACTSPFGTDVFDVPATTTSLALPTRYAASVQVYAITNKGYASSPATAPLVYDTVSESVVPTAISSGASAQVVVTVDSGKTPVSGDTLTLSAVDPSTGATCGNFTSISDPTGQTGNQGATDADGTITATLNVESVTVQTDCDIEAVEQETAPGTGSEATQTITISP